MFNLCRFYYDRDGVPLSHLLREVRAKDVNATGFALDSTTFQHCPAVCLSRVTKDPKADPYYDGSSLPSNMITLVYPHVEFLGGAVLIVGFEYPYLCHAGMLREPYDGCPPPGVPADRLFQDPGGFRKIDDLKRQKILLTNA